MLALRLCAIAAFSLAIVPAAVYAQGNDRHWAVSASITPKWTSDETLSDKLLNWHDPTEGSEVTIGIGRGSTRGGDWGVSYVRKPFKDSTSTELDASCSPPPFPVCTTSTQTRTLRDVWLKGVEFHWFVPFATIKNRFQIGLNVGGGVAKPEGTIEETLVFDTSFTNPQNGQVIHNGFNDTHTDAASEFLYPIVPLIKVEAQGALILAPALKVKFGGGLNMPSAGSFRIAATYLIGAR